MTSSNDYFCLCPISDYEPPEIVVPGTVEAEYFMAGGQLDAYYKIDVDYSFDESKQALRSEDVAIFCFDALTTNYTCIDQNSSSTVTTEGMNVGYIESGEWLRFFVTVEKSGNYLATYTISRSESVGDVKIYLLIGDIELSETSCEDYSIDKVGSFEGLFPDENIGEELNYLSFYSKEGADEFYLAAGTEHIIVCLAEATYVNFDSFTLTFVSSDKSGSANGTSTEVIVIAVLTSVLTLFCFFTMFTTLRKVKKKSVQSAINNTDFGGNMPKTESNTSSITPSNNSIKSSRWLNPNTSFFCFKMNKKPLKQNQNNMSSHSPHNRNSNHYLSNTGGAAVAVWAGIGIVASNLPHLERVYNILDDLILMYQLYLNIDENSYQIIQWANNVKKIVNKLDLHAAQQNQSVLDINMESIQECIYLLDRLKRLSESHKRNNLLLQFMLSKNSQQLINDITVLIERVVRSIDLDVNIACLGVSLRIDEKVSAIMGAIDDIRVDLAALGDSVLHVDKKLQNLERNDVLHDTNQLNQAVIEPTEPSSVSQVLSQIQVTNSMEFISHKPVGIGSFAKVFKVAYNGQVRAAKLMELEGMTIEQIQSVYLKFTRELYILSQLHHPRIVGLYGSVTEISRLAIIMEYLEGGSLRNLMNKTKEWSALAPPVKHQILVDICDGMQHLHSMKMYHRDLKSANILMTADFRAKLTDFGLSCTVAAVTGFTKRTEAMSHGGTVAYMPPESFMKTENRAEGSSSKHDVYSYGMITFEVLAAFSSFEKSIPWMDYREAEIIVAVLNDKRPQLPPDWDSADNVYASVDHHNVMVKCLASDPLIRPSFDEIMTIIYS